MGSSERRNRLKQKGIEYLGGQCSKCGYNKCNQALDFHHLNEFEKEFKLSKGFKERSWEACKNELDKCILVCANCHREIHAKENNGK